MDKDFKYNYIIVYVLAVTAVTIVFTAISDALGGAVACVISAMICILLEMKKLEEKYLKNLTR
ncbi:MAG: hypothetical protein IJL94_03535 [Erysipelotrichaceae bacterium]|nr:hypothetical protein [Erysipelotrichaceae bacterium]